MIEEWVIGSLIGAVVFVFYVTAACCAIKAVLSTRTPQGSIAWGVALLAMPFVSLPLYLVFGRSKFNGLVNARRSNDDHLKAVIDLVSPHVDRLKVHLETEFGDARVLSELTHMSFLRGNQTRLLVDGEATFEAMFAAINAAREYVLAEFYIVNNDELGGQFKAVLIAAVKRGCDVYLLFDEVGSHKLSRAYIRELQAAGVHVSGMKATRGITNRFQINFRNHRKIVVVDGKCALVGGLNVGDEYVHKSKRLTPWRDTHMQIDGPSALSAQLAFVEDWIWATGKIPKLSWVPNEAKNADKILFVLPSGPDDDYETCGLFFTHLINSARKRLWIASPYFVPDEGIVTALQLAAMRGVDVRILIPGLADKWLVKQAAMSFVSEVTSAGVKMYEYGNGFLHQKVAIADDQISVIGTANFDNRSFRLNFEISVVTIDAEFNNQVVAMLQNDFSNSTWIDPAEVAGRGWFFRITTRIARLFSPIL